MADPDKAAASDAQPDPDVLAARAALEDSGLVLHARSRLDDLALDLLASPGLAAPAVTRMRSFLDVDWPPAAEALERLGVLDAGGAA